MLDRVDEHFAVQLGQIIGGIARVEYWSADQPLRARTAFS